MTSTAAAPTTAQTTIEPAEVVRTFLEALQDGDLDRALDLLADDVLYINVSLPKIRGRRRIERLFRPAMERGGGFRVHFHAIATEGNIVLTDRTDGLIMGRVEQRLWVYGRFEVLDGRITLWRDSFDWLNVITGLLRGLVGAVVPSLNRPWPGER
jgi:limonene-1,2-epoxide hydrolase